MNCPFISVDVKVPLYMIYYTMKKRHRRDRMIADRGPKMGFVSVKDLLRGHAS